MANSLFAILLGTNFAELCCRHSFKKHIFHRNVCKKASFAVKKCLFSVIQQLEIFTFTGQLRIMPQLTNERAYLVGKASTKHQSRKLFHSHQNSFYYRFTKCQFKYIVIRFHFDIQRVFQSRWIHFLSKMIVVAAALWTLVFSGISHDLHVLASSDCSDCLMPVVKCPQGRLSGKVFKTREGRGIFGFLGIPYALPPVRELRFKVSKTLFEAGIFSLELKTAPQSHAV